MGRVRLIKTVVWSRLLYSFHIYSWPIATLKMLDMWLQNFICIGDIDERKLFTVSWKKKRWSPLEMGGLWIRSLKLINNVAIMKLIWSLATSDEPWAFCAILDFLRLVLLGNPISSLLFGQGSRIFFGLLRNIRFG